MKAYGTLTGTDKNRGIEVTPLQAGAKAKALALRVLAERMENEVSIPGINSIKTLERFGCPDYVAPTSLAMLS